MVSITVDKQPIFKKLFTDPTDFSTGWISGMGTEDLGLLIKPDKIETNWWKFDCIFSLHNWFMRYFDEYPVFWSKSGDMLRGWPDGSL